MTDAVAGGGAGLTPGELVDGRYRVERVLGEGAMGIVYVAEHVELGRPVALKLLHPTLAQSGELVERFRREAQRASNARHPGIVDVLDYGRDAAGRSYLVMELLEGLPLDALMNRGPLPIDQAVDLVVHTLDALAVAHESGLVHRDLKPQNLFVCDRDTRVKILDFGIAKLLREDQRLTTTGHVLGTPAYMSLEQMRDPGSVDARADVYAVGATLFEMLTGALPVQGTTMVALITAMVEDQVQRSPRALRPDVPPWLDAVVQRALAKHPDDRFPDARAFQQALLAGGAASFAPPPVPQIAPAGGISVLPPADFDAGAPTERAPVTGRRWGRIAAAAGLVVLAALGAGVALSRRPPPLRELEGWEAIALPTAAPTPAPSAFTWYAPGRLKPIPEDCARAQVMLATSPPGATERWTWNKQAFAAHPELEVIAGSAVLPGKVALAEHRTDRAAVLVASCDAPTCNRVAAMVQAVVPSSHAQLFCGRVPGLPPGRPITLVTRSAHDLPDPRSVNGRCARLTICLAREHPQHEDAIGLECQRSPSAFPLACTARPTCREVAACAAEAGAP